MTLRERFTREIGEYITMLKTVPPLALAVFILSVVSMNLLANKELFHTDWIALDCGFLLSWLPFLLMDCFCRVYGGKMAARVSAIAVLINLVTFFIFKLIVMTPGFWGQYYETGLAQVNDALNATIGGSTWIVFGSAFAMIVSSIVNSVVNMAVAGFAKGRGYGSFAARSFISTGVSQLVDNFTFALVVSIPLFGWSLKQAVFCSLTASLFELLMEIFFSGFGYKAARRWESYK